MIFSEFLKTYQTSGTKAIVCGCGCSASLILPYLNRRICTIGVNDIGELFTPDFLLCIDSPYNFTDKRRMTIDNTNSQWFVTHIPLWNKENSLYIELSGKGIDRIANKGTDNKFNYSIQSPYVAIILAYYLGYTEIGLLGVDFTDNHYNNNDGKHNLNNRLSEIDSDLKSLYNALQDNGCKLFNLSPTSRITSLPRLSIEKFYE